MGQFKNNPDFPKIRTTLLTWVIFFVLEDCSNIAPYTKLHSLSVSSTLSLEISHWICNYVVPVPIHCIRQNFSHALQLVPATNYGTKKLLEGTWESKMSACRKKSKDGIRLSKDPTSCVNWTFSFLISYTPLRKSLEKCTCVPNAVLYLILSWCRSTHADANALTPPLF